MTVLVVDDEPMQVVLVRRVLEKAGYEVIAAGSGDEAIARFAERKGRIDLLLTDVVMPGMDGGTLAERLRALQPGLRVLFVSGFLAQYEWVASVCSESGFDHLLAKPFSPSKLINEVKTMLAAGGRG